MVNNFISFLCARVAVRDHERKLHSGTQCGVVCEEYTLVIIDQDEQPQRHSLQQGIDVQRRTQQQAPVFRREAVPNSQLTFSVCLTRDVRLAGWFLETCPTRDHWDALTQDCEGHACFPRLGARAVEFEMFRIVCRSSRSTHRDGCRRA